MTGKGYKDSYMAWIFYDISILVLHFSFFSLTNYLRTCYPKAEILEVFAIAEATKTFDFVAFFLDAF